MSIVTTQDLIELTKVGLKKTKKTKKTKRKKGK